MITIPQLTEVQDIGDTDVVMITHSDGTSKKIAGQNILSAGTNTVMATSTSITGPALKTGMGIKVFFTVALTGSDTSTPLALTYNSVSKTVKVPKDGALADFCAVEVSSGVYKYCQAYTTLELIYDGTNFIIVGNPVVLSGGNYSIFADGIKFYQTINSITSGESRPVASGAVYNKTSVLNCVRQGYNILMPNYFAAILIIKVYGMDVAVYAVITGNNLNTISKTRLAGGNVDNCFERNNGYIKFVSGYEGRMMVIMQEPN